MNSFFMPQLGSQIYTMAGMTTQLNLQADQAGTYQGLSAQFSGAGFSDMRFTLVADSSEKFRAGLHEVRSRGGVLDSATFAQLARPTRAGGELTYGTVAGRPVRHGRTRALATRWSPNEAL